MAIVNRTLDPSEQRKSIGHQWGAVATGVTGIVAQIPWPCVLEDSQIAAFGVSGAPTFQLTVNRFVVGAGATAIVLAVAASNAVSAFGTSGPWNTVQVSSSSTLAILQEGDVVMYTSGASNAAVTGLAITLVVKPTQDIKKYFGT